jgi:hypothetical protein
MAMSRYRVGCAGMFALGMETGYDDQDAAIVACLHGPPGCEVYDSREGKWIGPTCAEDIEDAQARIDALNDGRAD